MTPFKSHTDSLIPSQYSTSYAYIQPISDSSNVINESLNVTLDAALNGISTDVKNVPIDRDSDTHKLLILLMSH